MEPLYWLASMLKTGIAPIIGAVTPGMAKSPMIWSWGGAAGFGQEVIDISIRVAIRVPIVLVFISISSCSGDLYRRDRLIYTLAMRAHPGPASSQEQKRGLLQDEY
jgi:hypothetical protein